METHSVMAEVSDGGTGASARGRASLCKSASECARDNNSAKFNWEVLVLLILLVIVIRISLVLNLFGLINKQGCPLF